MKADRSRFTESKLLKARNFLAAISSIIPGLGHIYKAHYSTGIGFMILSPFFILAGVFVGFATAGLGIFIPFFYILATGWHAYIIDDKRHHLGGIF